MSESVGSPGALPLRRPAILALFFISGACGLLYELVWIRMAGTVIGNTTYAIGTVVAVFMGGLALGARWGGRAADRRRGAALLRLYGILEAGVALSACAVPLLLLASEPLFRILWNAVGEIAPVYAALRVLLVAVILIVPTTLMGATLPILSRYLSDSGDAAAGEAGRAYAINTFGGVAGTLAAGFWMIPALGLRATLLAAAGANLAIAAAAVLLAKGKGGEANPTLSAEPPPRRLALVVSAISGFAALAYEVAWSRSLVLSIGSSVQALTLILSAFILGLALGSAIASRFAARAKDATLGVAILQAAVGVAALFLLPFLGDLPLQVAGTVNSLGKSYDKLLMAEFALIALMILVPATILGAVFPFTCRLAVGSDDSVGRTVGAVYTWNTLGSIAGTALASFALVPTIGLSATIRLAATLNLALAAFLLARFPGRLRWTAIAPLVAVIIGWITPAWSTAVLASGSYLFGPSYVDGARAMNVPIGDFVESFCPPVAQYWDGYGLASVHRQNVQGQGSILTLRMNGKPDASTDELDMMTQTFLGHVPLLHHPKPRRVLIIGLGAGFTLGAAARHPVEKIDCVEISSAIARAAEHFNEVTGFPLRDRSRVRLIVGDGRNLVQFSRESYDVIISEPSNLWVSGMANLFTREFFEQVRGRLSPGGLFCQWMCAFRLNAEDYRLVLRTFYSVFPEGSVWEITPGGDYLFLGCEKYVPPRYADFEARINEPHVRPDIEDPALAGPIELVGHLLMDARTAREIAGPGPIVTDDRLTLEYTAPRSVLTETRPGTLQMLQPARTRPVERAHFADLSDEVARRFAMRREDRRLYAEAVIASGLGRLDESWRLLQEAGKTLGADRQTQRFRENVLQNLLGQASMSIASGDAAGAIALLEQVPRSSSHWGAARIQLGRASFMLGRKEEARRHYREAIGDPVVKFDAFLGLAQLSEAEGQLKEAEGYWREAIRLRNVADVRVRFCAFLMQTGRLAEARESCLEALRLEPNNPTARKMMELLESRR